MRLLIDGGYGRGAFANLRCLADVSSDTVFVHPTAMLGVDGRRSPAVVIRGRTGKLSRVSEDNHVDIALHSMPLSEATILARRLPEFARLQDGTGVAQR